MFTTRVVRRRRNGFTLIELLVAMIVSGILISITTATYTLFRTSMNLDQSRAQLDQNGRLVLDRLSRELRQTQDVVTTFPASPSDNSIAQPGEIEFEDGNANDLTYRRYYIVSGVLKLDIKQYTFSYDPNTRVLWDAIGTSGESPNPTVLSTQDVADSVQSVAFYGDSLLQMIVTTIDSYGQTYTVRTTVLGRNTPLGRNS